MKQTICCVAGRSGGHIIPCISYAQSLFKENNEKALLFFSSNTNLDSSIGKQCEGITQQVALPLENVPYKKLWRYPSFFIQLIRSFYLAFVYLRKYKPSTIISTGGYTALPVCFMGKLLGIPFELFELNVVPGKATTLLAPFAQTVNACFPETQQYLKKCTLSFKNYPLRKQCFINQIKPSEALKKLSFSPHKKTILVLGGSQGSEALNNLVKGVIKKNKKIQTSVQVIHQIGNQAPEPFIQFYQEKNVPAQVFQFHPSIETIYPAADLVICRAGAGTLFETLHFKKQCITIPLEADTTTHQRDNALSFQNKYPEQFTMLEQKPLTINSQPLVDLINHFLFTPSAS